MHATKLNIKKNIELCNKSIQKEVKDLNIYKKLYMEFSIYLSINL